MSSESTVKSDAPFGDGGDRQAIIPTDKPVESTQAKSENRSEVGSAAPIDLLRDLANEVDRLSPNRTPQLASATKFLEAFERSLQDATGSRGLELAPTLGLGLSGFAPAAASHSWNQPPGGSEPPSTIGNSTPASSFDLFRAQDGLSSEHDSERGFDVERNSFVPVAVGTDMTPAVPAVADSGAADLLDVDQVQATPDAGSAQRHDAKPGVTAPSRTPSASRPAAAGFRPRATRRGKVREGGAAGSAELLQLTVRQARIEFEQAVRAGEPSKEQVNSYAGAGLNRILRAALNDADREGIIDALLEVCRPELSELRGLLARLAPAARTYLDGATSRGTTGWLATIAVLADLLEVDLGLVYYHEVQTHGIARLVGRPDDDAPAREIVSGIEGRVPLLVANCLNNALARLLRQLQSEGTTVRDAGQRLFLERTRLLAAVLGAGGELPAVDDATFDAVQALRAEHPLLRVLDRIWATTSFQPTIDRLVLTHANLIGALARCVLRSENVAVTFFNAGVELLRATHDNQAAPDAVYEGRVLCNALGLIWGSAVQVGVAVDVDHAVLVEDGMSSSFVNLFGALSDISRNRPSLLSEPVILAIRALHPLVRALHPQMSNSDRLKTTSAFETLKLPPVGPHPHAVTRRELTAAAAALLDAMLTAKGYPVIGMTAHPPDLDATADLIRATMRRAVGDAGWDAHMHAVRGFHQPLVQLFNDRDAILRDTLAQIEETPLPVRAEVYTLQEWNELVARSRTPEDVFVQQLQAMFRPS